MLWLFSNPLCSVAVLLEKCVCKEKVLGSVSDFCQMKYAYGKWVTYPRGMIISQCSFYACCNLMPMKNDRTKSWNERQDVFCLFCPVTCPTFDQNWTAFFMQRSMVSLFQQVSFPLYSREREKGGMVGFSISINDKTLASKLPLFLHSLCRFKWPFLFTKNAFNPVVYEHLVHVITWSKKGKLCDPKVWCACVTTQQSLLVGLI